MNNQKLISLGQLFRKSFEVYADKFKILIKISLLNLLVFILFMPFVGLFVALSVFSHENLILFIVGIFFLIIGVLFLVILGLWIYAALFLAVKGGNNQTKIKEIMPMAWKKVGSLFWVMFLAGIINFAGFVLVVIPGIIFSVWFSFAPYAYIFDNIKGFEALKKSRELVKGRWWPIFGRIAIIMLVSFLVSSIRGFGPIINVLFLTPFIIIFLNNIYEDLKK